MKKLNVIFSILFLLTVIFSCSEDNLVLQEDLNSLQINELKTTYRGTQYETEPNNTKATANPFIHPGMKYVGTVAYNNNDVARIQVDFASTTFYLDAPSYVFAAIRRYSTDELIANISGKQAITFNNLPLGNYYVVIAGYLTANYIFYNDPEYSVVNSLYFLINDRGVWPSPVVKYTSSATPISGAGTLVEIDSWYNFNSSTQGYWYRTTQPFTQTYGIGYPFYYSNNHWPILFYLLQVGL